MLEFRPGITGVRALALLTALACAATPLGACAARQSKAGTHASDVMTPLAASSRRVTGLEVSAVPVATPAPPAGHIADRSSKSTGTVAGGLGSAILYPFRMAGGALGSVFSRRPAASDVRAKPVASDAPSATATAKSPEVAEAASPRNVSASPVATPGPSGVVGAAAGAVGKVVLFPLKVASNEVKKNYSADDRSGLGAARAAEAARQSAKPKTRIEKAEDAVGTAADTAEKTVSFPWRILDDFLGFLFSPF